MDSNQQAFSGEQFTLRESQDRNQIIEIEATRDGRTGRYDVKLGSVHGSGATLAFALHELASVCEDRELYGSDNLTEFAITKRKITTCKYCQAPIWFALTANDKWMPLDKDPVRAREIKNARRYAVTMDYARLQNRVRRLENHQNSGMVWICHPDICGATREAPEDEVLRARWDAYRNGAGLNEQRIRREICDDIQELESEGLVD